jgi:hypothetical protein
MSVYGTALPSLQCSKTTVVAPPPMWIAFYAARSRAISRWTDLLKAWK